MEEPKTCAGKYDCCLMNFSPEKSLTYCECWNLGGKFGSKCETLHPEKLSILDSWRSSCPP
jgi:hypothetical protein